MKSDVLTAMNTKNIVFSDVTMYVARKAGVLIFGGLCCVLLQVYSVTPHKTKIFNFFFE